MTTNITEWEQIEELLNEINELGLYDKQIAERLGVQAMVVSRWRKGQIRMPIVIRLALTWLRYEQREANKAASRAVDKIRQ